MDIKCFDYKLKPGLISQYPQKPRSSSKLLILFRDSGEKIHTTFSLLDRYLEPGDVLVLNNTRVFKARLFFFSDNLQVEVFILNKLSSRIFEALLRPRKKLKENQILFLRGRQDLSLRILDLTHNIVEFNRDLTYEDLDRLGFVPLPPYIKRKPAGVDEEYYQTIYAQEAGSIAAPTAGFHFSPQVIELLKKRSVSIVYITLHINYATFKPLRLQDVKFHQMLPEYFSVPFDTADFLNKSLEEKRRIVAVGTSTVRALESASDERGRIKSLEGFTELFIYPGYRFKIIRGMITNFHLPRSSPLVLVSAFAGRERLIQAYQEAQERNYRFYSYGDAMLIL